MKDLVLPVKLANTNGLSWSEEIPEGSRQSSSSTFGSDFGQAILNIKVDAHWANFNQDPKLGIGVISHIVGYSECRSQTTNKPFDAAIPGAQGPYKLYRKIPARHPAYPNLFATKILSIQGRGLRNSDRFQRLGIPGSEDVGGAIDVGDPNAHGVYGTYAYAYLSILFEIPRYPIMTDAELAGRSELVRYHEWLPDTNIETLARKGQIWTFCDVPVDPVVQAFGQRTFPGDRLLRQAKTKITIRGYDFHEPYVMLGKVIPSNYHSRVGTLNARAFPPTADAYRDQNKAGAGAASKVQFKPGTCLLLPPKITPHAQCHPAVLSGQISPDLFPRTVDIETNFLVFDPKIYDEAGSNPSTVNLDATGVGDINTIIRGHNLAPLTIPRLEPNGKYYIWYPCKNTPRAGNPVTDRELLYQYSDWSKLWQSCESLP